MQDEAIPDAVDRLEQLAEHHGAHLPDEIRTVLTVDLTPTDHDILEDIVENTAEGGMMR